jgi:hypothetical protein
MCQTHLSQRLKSYKKNFVRPDVFFVGKIVLDFFVKIFFCWARFFFVRMLCFFRQEPTTKQKMDMLVEAAKFVETVIPPSPLF